ncbi:hypothetical protein EDC04DRAFT_2704481 [Pisolithus marmoratus]|nr:hypothetical protein EDC04DRAFT_2704481 [Pisolithus marmoratus]
MKPKAPRDRYIGPYSVREFLDVFLPCHGQLPDTPVVDNEKLRKVTEVESKDDMLEPFISAMQECAPGMTFEAEANDRENKMGAQTGDYYNVHETDVDLSPVLELCVIFRSSTAYDPFDDSNGSVSPSPPFERGHSTKGNQTKSQITSTAHAHLEPHFPRLIRWDHAGAIVTNRFNYVDNSHLLVEFFWRFAHITRGGRGHDASMRGLELQMFSGGFGRVTGVSSDVEASCVLDLQALSRRVKATKLYGNQVRGRLECPPPVELRGRDWESAGVFGERKATADSKELGRQRDNRGGESGYKILLGPAGRTLTNFGSAKEMMQGVLDALQGLRHAYKKAKYMHRNICPENILLTEQGRGFLIGWDLCAIDEKHSGESA